AAGHMRSGRHGDRAKPEGSLRQGHARSRHSGMSASAGYVAPRYGRLLVEDFRMNTPVKFLLVDDLSENLLSLEGLLRREGLMLLKAQSGDEALELLLQHDVALALVDVQMPGLNGFELAELMRGNERTRRIPIIFVTAGSADGQRRFQGYEAGAVDFIQKPIEPGILRSKVDVFFELYRQRQQLAAQRDELAAQAEALKEAARYKDILLREINHRIKNLFSLTAGLISLSARPATSVGELVTDLR